ncbi:hypothetical protein EYF80_015384 [Liparis tanakae]|uniref:Uncharacterized protein n=1 Tax=Liparis tanakae TaxID=230148 RepID=A0A4Z2IAJ0_9TELE|nr:hypothetical protein EYF80_015384 [Liparis tanakae]
MIYDIVPMKPCVSPFFNHRHTLDSEGRGAVRKPPDNKGRSVPPRRSGREAGRLPLFPWMMGILQVHAIRCNPPSLGSYRLWSHTEPRARGSAVSKFGGRSPTLEKRLPCPRFSSSTEFSALMELADDILQASDLGLLLIQHHDKT